MEQPCERDKLNGDAKIYSWRPLFRQIFVCSGVVMNFFICGLFFGAPTILIPQLRNHANTSDVISIEKASWLVSISSYGSIPWTFICPMIAEIYGRKVPYIILWMNTLLCVTLFYFSTSFIELFISGLFQGMFFAIQMTIAIMVITEYTSPKYRGIFLTFKGATLFWGIWVSNTIGAFYHWKNIGILIFVCCFYTFTPVFWPESPVWLATKGRFDECAKSHRWLKGNDKDSEEELKTLILIHKKRIQEYQLDNLNKCISKFYSSINDKRFYKPQIYALLTTFLYHFSGKLACAGYIIDIIKTITANESTAYVAMLVLDGVTVLGMYIGVFISTFFKRRTLLLGSACIGVMFMFILSTYLYLVSLDFISKNIYFILFLLIGFALSISCGPILLCKCVAGEITPIRSRSLYLSIYALLTSTIMGSVLKMFPYALKYLNAHGAFLFYAITSSIFIYILYKVLPETKDKTILEIEKYFSDDENIVQEQVELMNPDEARMK